MKQPDKSLFMSNLKAERRQLERQLAAGKADDNSLLETSAGTVATIRPFTPMAEQAEARLAELERLTTRHVHEAEVMPVFVKYVEWGQGERTRLVGETVQAETDILEMYATGEPPFLAVKAWQAAMLASKELDTLVAPFAKEGSDALANPWPVTKPRLPGGKRTTWATIADSFAVYDSIIGVLKYNNGKFQVPRVDAGYQPRVRSAEDAKASRDSQRAKFAEQGGSPEWPGQ